MNKLLFLFIYVLIGVGIVSGHPKNIPQDDAMVAVWIWPAIVSGQMWRDYNSEPKP